MPPGYENKTGRTGGGKDGESKAAPSSFEGHKKLDLKTDQLQNKRGKSVKIRTIASIESTCRNCGLNRFP